MDVPALQRALSEQKIDAWLLYDFQDQNPTALGALGLGGRMLTRLGGGKRQKADQYGRRAGARAPPPAASRPSRRRASPVRRRARRRRGKSTRAARSWSVAGAR